MTNSKFNIAINAKAIATAWFFALLLLLSGWPSLSFAVLDAGTIIENRAEATWFNPEIQRFELLRSNAVEVEVLPLFDGLLQTDQSVLRLPGDFVVFPHRLTNTGNTPLAFELAVNNLSGDDYDLIGLRLIEDRNGNGSADPGEREFVVGDSVDLRPSESIELLVVGTVPTTAGENAIARVEITAISGDLRLSNTDDVTSQENVSILFNKSLENQNPVPGDRLRYRLQVINNGFAPAFGLPIRIDGVEQVEPLVLIRDKVPANTVYAGLDHSEEGEVLYRLQGFSEFDYVSQPPIDLSQIVTVAYALRNLMPGDPIELFVELDLNENASGTIDNQADIVFSGSGNEPVVELSNLTETPLPPLPPTVQFFSNNEFDEPLGFARAGVPLFLQTDASRCNLDAAVAETHPLRLIGRQSGDFEIVTARETGPNTGVFQVLPPLQTEALSGSPTQNNGVMELLLSDEVRAELNACGPPASATLPISPGGTVFDSRTSAPVPGAQVILTDVTGDGNGGNAGGPAQVFDEDGVTPISHIVITDENGRFAFPVVLPSIYRIEVIPPTGSNYFFPSLIPPGEQPPRRLIPEALFGQTIAPSYGGQLLVAQTGPIALDIPLDLPVAGLGVAITTDEDIVDIGDLVRTTVTISNLTGNTLTNSNIRLTLPPGFTLQDGSVLLNGSRIEDPEIVDGVLILPLGSMETDQVDTVTFLLQVGAGATGGRISVLGDSQESEPAFASTSIRLRSSQFHGYILGRVYLDCDRDRVQGVEEPGIPGVRIYMEDGTYVVTDTEGKYNFYGVAPGTHVLKVDSTTLPRDSVLLTLDNRHGGDAHSRFVDLKRHELHKANFAEGSCSDAVKQEVWRRRGSGEVFVGEIENVLNQPLEVDSRRSRSVDPRRLPSSGVADGQQIPDFTSLADDVTGLGPARDISNPELRGLASEPVVEVQDATPDLSSRIASFDNSTAFIDIRDGDVMPAPRLTVRGKGNLAGGLRLELNGEVVPDKQVGLRMKDNARQLLVQEWVGLHLEPGKNTVALSLVDPFGNARDRQEISIMAPGRLAVIQVNVNEDGTPADGIAVATVEVLVQDVDGVPVTTSMPLTIESSLGRWLEDDAQPNERGLQVLIRGGRAELKLQAPQQPGDAAVRVSTGRLIGGAKVAFLPPLREMIAVGLIEGQYSRGLGNDNAGGTDSTFERELDNFSNVSNSGRSKVAGRSAVFMQGRVGSDTLMTLSYDSEKDADLRLFRDIRPDEFYPVYGDSSVRGFEARSTSKLFLRFDRRQSYLQYGDFSTAPESSAVSLGRFNRSLTGVEHHFENGRAAINAFASRGTSRQQVVEFRGRGISGPYREIGRNAEPNSERIEIVTRDRDAPSVELRTRALSRFTDYVVDYERGEIVFREPISAFDASLNPEFVRVTFETDQGGERFWVAGVNGQVHLTKKLELGAAYAEDNNPEEKYRVASVNATVKLTEKTKLVGEYAITDSEASSSSEEFGQGSAYRVEVEHGGETLQGRAYYANTEENFDNNTAGFGRGREEYGVRANLRLGDRTRLIAEWLNTEDKQNNSSREGLNIGVERTITDNLQLELAFRKSEDTTNDDVRDATTFRLKLSGQVPKIANLSMFLEGERSVSESGKELVALGLEYQLANRSRLYARHEFISSLGSRFALDSSSRQNQTVFGVDTDYMQDGHLFSEYRIRDAQSGRDAEAALGLRNSWELFEGMRLQTSFERTDTLQGDSSNDSLALTAAIEYTANPLWKTSARIEYRRANQGDSWFSSLGLARKLSRDWVFLGRNTLSLQEQSGGDKLEDRLQLGFAFRPADSDRWNALLRYELNTTRDKSLDDSRRLKHLWATNVHYQPRNSVTWTGHYSGKYIRDSRSAESSVSTDAHLLSLRMNWDISERWDIGLIGSGYFTDSLNQQRYGLGVETGFLVRSNLWVSIGYNWFGYEDPDIEAAEYSQEGVYFRFRFKFDERLFADFERTPTHKGF